MRDVSFEKYKARIIGGRKEDRVECLAILARLETWSLLCLL